jgi:hypothetical protein
MHLISDWNCPHLKGHYLEARVMSALVLMILAPAFCLGTELEPFSATYTISRAAFKAERTVELSRDGSEYLLTAKTTLKGLASLAGRGTAVETSRFQFTQDRIIPILYTAHDGTGNPDRIIRIEFDFSSGVTRAQARGSEHLLKLDQEVFDPLTFELMARIDLRNGVTEPHYMVHEGDRLRPYQFRRKGTETIMVRRKKLNTVRYLIDRQSSRQLYYWLSPDLDHLMVQLRQVHEGKTKASGILTWSSLLL